MSTPTPPTPPESQNQPPAQPPNWSPQPPQGWQQPGPQNWPPPFQSYPHVPQPPRRNGFWQHPAVLIIAYGLLTIVLMIVFVIFGVIGWLVLHAGKTPNLTPTGQPILLISEIVQALAAFIAFVIMVNAVERRPLASAGFSPRRLGVETTGGFALGALLMTAVIAASAALGVYRAFGLDPNFGLIVWLVTFLFTAIFEETVFRGYVLRLVTERWGPMWGLIVSSILFGLVHLMNPTPGATTAEHVVGPIFITFEAGLLMGALFLLTRRLWLSIGLHWAWNFFEGPIYGSDVSGIHSASLIRAQIHGPFPLTGGVFGPEAGVPCLIICTAAAMALIQKIKRDGKWAAVPETAQANPIPGSTFPPAA